MFSKPIRPNFPNEFFPIIYSDLWGDYWGYFSFTRDAVLTGRNQALIGDYLARVNIVSIIPTIILLLGFSSLGIKKQTKKRKRLFLYLHSSNNCCFFHRIHLVLNKVSKPSIRRHE